MHIHDSVLCKKQYEEISNVLYEIECTQLPTKTGWINVQKYRIELCRDSCDWEVQYPGKGIQLLLDYLYKCQFDLHKYYMLMSLIKNEFVMAHPEVIQ